MPGCLGSRDDGVTDASILTLEKISQALRRLVVADDIDLDAREGEALGIIGPNGAGKTTLFNLITGTVAPDAGPRRCSTAATSPAAAARALPPRHRRARSRSRIRSAA